MNKTIIVCERCKIPLIWTFAWAKHEYYCINCGGHWGALGGGESIPLTPELKKQKRVIYRLWKIIYKNLIPRSDYKKDNCKKCTQSKELYSHRSHLTPTEKRKNKIVTQILKGMRGAWKNT